MRASGKCGIVQVVRGGITLAVECLVTRCLFSAHLVLSSALVLALASAAHAQSNPSSNSAAAPGTASDATGASPAAPAVAAQAADDDGALDLAQPDFFVVNIPTTLRLPLHKGTFRLTHRFGGNLRDGSFGDQASNLFGLDQGAVIGLEYRYAVMTHLQAAITRSSFDKTVQFSGKYDPIRQTSTMPVSVSGLVAIEGPNNFKERFAPSLGLVVSREVEDRLAVYATPVWTHNSAASTDVNRDTLVLGLGGRARVGTTVYVVGEVSPRVAGYKPGQVEYAFGVEKRAGGHMFQLTFANSFGTTFGQLARGGSPETLYLGFNLTRKFF
jgi:hypothetical protein